MVKNRKITIRLTSLQEQLVENKAKALGFNNKSSFARDRILGDELDVERKVSEIYNGLIG